MMQWSATNKTSRIDQTHFSLLLYNINSLHLHLEDLICYVCSSYPTIWALTGLHFNELANYQLASFFKSRYTLYYQQGTNPFGGVCFAIAREVPHRVVPQFSDINNLIVVDIFNNSKRYTFATMYSPPSEKLSFSLLDRLYQYNLNLIIIGDLNARHPNWFDVHTNHKGSQLNEWICDKEDLRIYNAPQPTSLRSQAILDLVIAPVQLSSESTQVDQSLQTTDHYPVRWNISSFKSISSHRYHVKRINWKLINCILDLKQNFFFTLADLMKNEPTEFILLYEKFLVSLQERCTTYHIIKNYRPSLPIYLVNIIKQRRRLLHLYRSTQLDEHRACLSRMNRYIHYELRAIKKVQWQEFCHRLEPKNTQRFWKHARNLFQKRYHHIQGLIDEDNDQILCEPHLMIKHAFEYYSTAFQEIESPVQNGEVSSFSKNITEKVLELPSKSFLFKINDLSLAIRRLKTKNSSGHEKVSNTLIKSIPITHYCFLLEIFNQLLVRNEYPQHWKMSKMILLPKEKSRLLSLNKTRPISLLPCLSKVYERCFLVYLRQWMDDSGIHQPEQSGFRERHSTTTRFVKFLQDISSGLLQQTAALVIYVDFTKAFDQLWHAGLLYKLYQMHCPQQIFSFILQYLKNRRCFIEMNELMSDSFAVEKGVPQGSCLGPILFLLYHHNLAENIPSATHKHLYADDLGLVLIASPWWRRSELVPRMQKIAQQVLHEAELYAAEWKQPINHSKTEWQWIHRRVHMPTITLQIGQHILNRTSVFKYLGNYVDERLSFTHHCSKMLEKIQRNSILLRYVARSKTSLKARNLISNAFILPYLQLMYVVWPVLSISTITKIEAKNRQLHRIIYNWWDASTQEVASLPDFETAETKAQRFLRRFIDKVSLVLPDLFEDYILTKAMPMYMRMHLEMPFIPALPVGRFNKHVRFWIREEHLRHRTCYLNQLSRLLSKTH